METYLNWLILLSAFALITVTFYYRRQVRILDTIYSVAYELARDGLDDHTQDLSALGELIEHVKSKDKHARIHALNSESIKQLVKLYIDDCTLPTQKTVLGYCMLLDRRLIDGDKAIVRHRNKSVSTWKFLVTLHEGLYDGSQDRYDH